MHTPLHATNHLTTQHGALKGYKYKECERDNITDTVTEIQLHARKLLSQASEIGLSVFNNAPVFWKERKGNVVRAHEEHVAGLGLGESFRIAEGMRD